MEGMMKIQRILILYSWDDQISQNRLAAQISSPLLHDYTFEHCFALENEHEIPDITSIVERVCREIDIFKPDTLLLHTGAAFHREPEVFFKAFDLIYERYPQLRMGLERRGRFSAPIFEESEEMKEVEELFFGGYYISEEG
jgi:hypothetical protein